MNKHLGLLILPLAFSVVGIVFPFLHVYSNNVTNLEFGLGVLLPHLALGAGLLTGLLWALFIWFSPKLRAGASLIVLYITSMFWFMTNFSAGEYGFLDNQGPDWNANLALGYVEITFFVLALGIFIRFRSPIEKNATFAAIILIISSFAYLPQILVEVAKAPEKGYFFSEAGIYDLSKNTNVIVFILDTAQADVFNEIIHENPGWKERLAGFTLYRNSLSAFPKTYGSIPALLTGEAFDNSQTLQQYLKNNFTGPNSLPRFLLEEDFDVRLWSAAPTSLFASPALAHNISNETSAPVYRDRALAKDWRLLGNMMLFRLSPHFAKPWIYNDGRFRLPAGVDGETDPDSDIFCRLKEDDRVASKEVRFFDSVFTDQFLKCASGDREENAFRLYHLLGAHGPFRFDRDFNHIGTQAANRENFRNHYEGALVLVHRMVEKLKALDVFDNSLIVIAGDHGGGEFAAGLNLSLPGLPESGNQNPRISANKIWGAIPLILIKPPGNDSEFRISDAPVELSDIPATITDILGYAHYQGPGMPMHRIAADQARIRRHKYYQYSGWNIDFILPMTEYLVDGFSWYSGSWKESNVDFNSNASRSYDGLLLGMHSAPEGMAVLKGWSDPNPRGRKVIGTNANVTFLENIEGTALLTMVHSIARGKTADKLEMYVRIGDENVGRWSFYSNDGQRRKTAVISENLANRLTTEGLSLTAEGKGSPRIAEFRIDPLKKYSYELGTPISFVHDAGTEPYKTHGWLAPKSWGASSTGYESGIFLGLSKNVERDLMLSVKLRPFVYPARPTKSVNVFVNDVLLRKMVLTERNFRDVDISIPADLHSGKRYLDIRFVYADPIRPSQINSRWDTALRAIAVERVVVSQGD